MAHRRIRLFGFAALVPVLVLAAACSKPADNPPAAAPAKDRVVAVTPPAQPTVVPAGDPGQLPALDALPDASVAGLAPEAQGVNTAAFAATPDPKAARIGEARPDLIRLQVLLDRARFSPGEIDGRDGSNQAVALAAYESAHGLPVDGKPDEAVWKILAEADTAPVIQRYTLTAEDVAGPFISAVPADIKDKAALPRLGFTNVAEALAEKFHMAPALLKALNPGADFAAGTVITAVVPRAPLVDVQVATVQVDRAARSVRAYDQNGELVAAYPASVGSTDMPAPSGTWAVRAVAPNPAYYYDPSRLTFGRAEAKGKLKIAAGPNNPVGSTWIDLTKDTYGIHGTPDPETIGKRQSHGCVRLTNWDAAELGKAIKKGATVAFVGANTAKRAKAT